MKKLAKYCKLCAPIEPILLAFLSLYMAESGFSHVYHSPSKQRSTLNIECDDLWFKLTNLQSNICGFRAFQNTSIKK